MRKRFEYDIFYSHWLVAKCLYFIKYNLLNLSKKQPFIKYKPQTIHMGIGAIYILTKNFFKSYNQLEFPLFLYGEEAFFSHQIHKVAGVIMFEPDLIVHHAESAATSKLPKRQVYEYSRKGYPLYRNYL
jgi:GT2 family glycosyltransferase